MTTASIKANQKTHPHIFTLWVGIASIIMMFAGLTSAYIVKRNQANWQTFELPVAFWYSTIAVIFSSITMYLALKMFKKREMKSYRRLMVATMILGVLFILLQIMGFNNLWQKGITLQVNVSYSFLYIIVGLHALHVLGGVVALIVMSLLAFNRAKKVYTSVPLEVMSTYWHFVGVLWIYLLVFLILIK